MKMKLGLFMNIIANDIENIDNRFIKIKLEYANNK